MSKEKVIANMKKTLDWNAREYGNYTDADVKKSIAKEYRVEAKAFNSLLRDMYSRATAEDFFSGKIETYINIRECEDWK